ncbi:MAG TPA: hypothetical protein VMR50_05700 [Myxococcota bacterium]|nr:hypothetical protein [Myxococcota bacterium]
MASALADVEWEACVLEPRRDRELEAFVRSRFGAVPSAVPYFTRVPWVVRSMPVLGPDAPLLTLDSLLPDLIGLVVSQDNSCRYCFGVQRMLLRVHGLPDSRIRKLEQGFIDAEIEPRFRAALDFARRLSRASPLSAASDLTPLRDAGWSPPEIRELAYATAFNVYMNRMMTTVAIPYAPVESLADSWLIRVMTPLLRYLNVRRARKAQALASARPTEPARGPWAYLLDALSGAPASHALRETLDAALESSVLSRRAKGLVFAVVARGLEAPHAAAAASALLGECGLAPEVLESALTHLGSSELNGVENALLSFARGTIRGRPMQLQQRARALLDRLSPEQLIEAVGVAALANLVTRLDVVVPGR